MLLKGRIGQILDPTHSEGSLSRAVNICLMTLVFLNVLAVIFETVKEVGQKYGVFFTVFEYFSVLIFSVEYLLRLWTCEQLTGVKGRLSFAMSPMAIIDLLAKYSQSLKLLGKVFTNKKEELVITVTIAFILLIMASSIIYFIENKAQPEVFSSIPAVMWWSVGATTRLGVGAMNPVTEIGMVAGSLIALLGLGVFALPAGIIASGLIEEMQNEKKNGRS